MKWPSMSPYMGSGGFLVTIIEDRTMSKFQIYRGPNGGEQCWCWRLLAGNDRIIADGANPFLKGDIRNSIKGIRAVADGLDSQRFEIAGDGISWHLKDDQGETIAIGKIDVSGTDRENYLEDLCKEIKDAEITWENEADDPAHQAKDDDTTPTKGVPGS